MSEISLFSIVIPLYNKEKDILHTLNSLSLQTFTNYEVIIVDDGSTDQSLEIVQNLNDPRITVYSKPNEGVAPTRNFGVNKSNGEYVVFLDADDYWYPFHLEDINELIKSFPQGNWFATAYEKKFNKKLITTLNSPIMNKGENWKGIVSNYFENCFADCLAWTSAVCFKKSFFKELGGFDTSITMGAGEDTDLWLRAALHSPLVFSNKISATHNLVASNRISNSPTLKRRFINLDRYELEALVHPGLKKYLDLNRYSIALQYLLAGESKIAKSYLEKINFENLNSKQKFLLKLPTIGLKIFLGIKRKLSLLGVRTTSF